MIILKWFSCIMYLICSFMLVFCEEGEEKAIIGWIIAFFGWFILFIII